MVMSFFTYKPFVLIGKIFYDARDQTIGPCFKLIVSLKYGVLFYLIMNDHYRVETLK